jgi:hypothetical protein
MILVHHPVIQFPDIRHWFLERALAETEPSMNGANKGLGSKSRIFLMLLSKGKGLVGPSQERPIL